MSGEMFSRQMESRTRNIMVRKKRRSGYLQRFRHNICLNDYGVPAEFIDWCKKKSKGLWGWWFETCPEWNEFHANPYNPEYHEKNTAYMSFQLKRDAVRFWFENVKAMADAQRR
jgi:hypothetical protein